MIAEISLIIPSHNDEVNLNKLLDKIHNWELIPDEILVIDSSIKKTPISEDFKRFVNDNDIKYELIFQKNLYPGHARNIGINNSKNSILAFLDTSTHPTNIWLSNGIKIMNEKKPEGVWGKTFYEANSLTSKIIRACTYGDAPIRTLPGTIVHRSVFNKCGLFIEQTRAGEDGDWMHRTELQNINMVDSNEFLQYKKLKFISIMYLLKKWFRNYTFSSRLPHRQKHKNLYYFVLSFFVVLFAYNWNRVFAAWNADNILYIPNITKISIFLILLSYISFRGLILPLKKGVTYKFLFPINFIYIILLSVLLDAVKLSAFLCSNIFYKNS